MNVENIQKVRDHIASLPPEQFDMGKWSNTNDCGTCACIGGWAETLLYKRGVSSIRSDYIVGKRLGLTEGQSDALFYPHALNRPWSAVTPTHAVQVLDHLLSTGKVDWSIIGGAS